MNDYVILNGVKKRQGEYRDYAKFNSRFKR